MEDITAAFAGVSIIAIIAIIIVYIRIKYYLKQELVDPDIKRLEGIIESMRADFTQKVADLEEHNNKLSAKLDKKFDELNNKMDKNSQAVSQMQGMLTAIFNGLRNSQYDQ